MLSVLLSPTYALGDCPQSLQQLPKGHLLCLHPQDHPPEGQWKTSCPANRHFHRKKRQLACFFPNGASESGWRWRERGTVAVASPAEQKGRGRCSRVNKPRMWLPDAGGKRYERGGVYAARRCWAACEKWMLSRMERMLQRRMREWCWSCDGCDGPSCSDESSAEGCRAQDAGDGDGEEVEREAASFAHACFSLSTHDGANLCRPGKQGGGGEVKVNVAVSHKQLIQQWHPVWRQGITALSWKSLICRKTHRPTGHAPLIMLHCHHVTTLGYDKNDAFSLDCNTLVFLNEHVRASLVLIYNHILMHPYETIIS